MTVTRGGFGKLMSKGLTKTKARKMLHDNMAQGHELTKKQRGYFGLVASGKKPSRLMKKNPSEPKGSGGCYPAMGKIGIG